MNWPIVMYGFFWIAAVFTTEEIFRSVYTVSWQNKRLSGKAVKNIDSPSLMSCSQLCLRHSWCTSTNFKESFGKSSESNCELNKHDFNAINDETKLMDQPGTAFTTFLKPGCRVTGCLNGGSCFFDNDKETFVCSCILSWRGERCELGTNMCSSNPCLYGATCTNILNGYTCACSAYFTGQRCEIPLGTNMCSSNPCLYGATCTNILNGYTCACSAHFTGQRCEIPLGSECSSYTLNSEADRGLLAPQVGSINNGSIKCDNALVTAWYRFNSTAGTRMPTTCVSKYRCNTHAPGWLYGAHPSPMEGIVQRYVCFHWENRCCRFNTPISVRNCGLFYVYKLRKPSNCYLRYCVTK